MQRAIVRTVDGEALTEYVDCGPGRARGRGSAGEMHTGTTAGGLRLPDFLFSHPAADVRKQPGDKSTR